MSEAFQIATHTIIWASTLLAVASCVLRCYHCKYIKRTWKADDFMSLIIGVSLFGLLFFVPRLTLQDLTSRFAWPMATSLVSRLRRVSVTDEITSCSCECKKLILLQARTERMQLH
jgi:hypothetical protein